ncbi:hypothetical protein DL96DRAFT_1757765 [Flagelloscypha sp. PMI_526]|nr:hypothetical protein DL96DRAFT_1757765 [Flagelloscypha sp. PMI_526]
MSAATEGSGIRAISFDGGITGTGGLTQLHTVKEIIARLDYDLNECKEEKVSKPCETFDLFAGTGLGGLYVLLFTRLKMTVDEVIAFHGRLHRELFSSQSWNEKDKESCKALLDGIVLESLDAQALDENLDSPDSPKGFICVLNVSTPSTPHFLRTYRVRSNFGPRCTVREALYTTLADRVHLPPVPIIHDDITSLFMGAGIGFNNPTALLLEEILPCFPKANSVSGILNLGAGYMPLHSLNTTRAEADAFRNIIMDCEGVVQALQAQCHDIGQLFTRISVEHLPEDALEPSRYFQRVYAHTHEFLSQHRISGLIDDIIVILKERRHIVSPARLVNLAGKTAKVETIFTPKMETIQTPRDTEAFIRKRTTKILLPDRTVSYLGQEHSPCLAGTRAEMMAKIQDWMYDIHAPNVKVIQGFPGTGKSTFSLSLAKILSERRHLGGRFFCRRMDSVHHTPHIFWRLLAVQLVQNYPPFAEAIAAQLQYRIPDMDLMSAEEIFRFLFTPMQSITSSELFVFIVDGIDQFGGLQQQSSAREELIRSFTLWQDLPPFCRLFITTGQDAEITAAFNSDPLILDSLETDFESRGDILMCVRTYCPIKTRFSTVQ